MNQHTKQRVVGSIVLLALGLIFLPIIFDGEGSYQRQLTSRIPAPPEIEPLAEPVQTRPRILADSDEINLSTEQLAANQPNRNPDQLGATSEPTVSASETDALAGNPPPESNNDPGNASIADSGSVSYEALIQSLATASSNEDQAEVVVSQPVFSRLETPQLDGRGLPQSWSVRLGSFSDGANARSLVNDLQEAGYKAYTRTMRREQGDLIAVFVGPWVDRQRVDEYKEMLQQEFQLDGMVVRFEIDRL